MKKLTLFFFLFVHVALFSQPPIQWQKCLGGNKEDEANSILIANDGGYLVAGRACSYEGDVTGNNGACEGWLVKLDQGGLIQWQKCLGGNYSDEFTSVLSANDGGYIVAGSTWSNEDDVSGNHGGIDVWLVKLDQTASILWQKCLGGSNFEWTRSLQATEDGGYIMAGHTFSNDGNVSGNHGNGDYWIVKVDSVGAIQWQRCLGGGKFDSAHSASQTNDGGYIVAGKTESKDGDVTDHHGFSDAWIVKLDSSGAIQWQKALGGTGDDVAQTIRQTADGGYLMVGYNGANDGDISGNNGVRDVWVVKLNQSGSIEWQKSLGGTANDYGYSFQFTSDSGYVVAGFSQSNDGAGIGDVTGNHGGYDSWLLKLDKDGNLQWQKSMGGSYDDLAYSIQITDDGGYIVVGYTKSNNADVTDNHGERDFWIVKLGPVSGVDDPLNEGVEWQVFPNPATAYIEIRSDQNDPIESIIITDVLGKPCSRQCFPLYESIDLSGLPSGLYVIQAETQTGKVFRKKIIKH